MWRLLAACASQTEPQATPPEAIAEPAPPPSPPAPAVPPEETARVFSGWLDPQDAGEGQRWFALDLLEASFAAALDEAPPEYEKLSNIAGEGRSGWILEGFARAETLEAASDWRIRVVEMGERYTDCHSDGPWPSYTGPVFADGVVRFVAEDREPYRCAGSPDLVLRPSGAQIEVSYCGRSFLARRDSLQRRYQAVEDAWTRAEIARLKLKQGSKPENVLHGKLEMQCFPASLMGAPDDRPRLACDAVDPKQDREVWFDTDGRAREDHLHNECGWRAIEPKGLEGH